MKSAMPIDYQISSLPTNAEAERTILGAILLDNAAFNEAAQHLTSADFSLDSHRRIYVEEIVREEKRRKRIRKEKQGSNRSPRMTINPSMRKVGPPCYRDIQTRCGRLQKLSKI
jgi:hypothetical protein